MSVYYKWFRSFFGCSQIKVTGNAESFINALSQKNIYFWGSKIDENQSLTLYGSVFSAGQIVDTAEKMGYDVDVVQRYGLPFVFEKYKKRYGIMIGAVIAWAILFLTSLTVWEVRVAERSGEDPQKICALLEQCDLKMGTFLPTLNVRAVENQFLLNNPEYSFLAVNIYGTVANVEIRRASEKDDVEDKSKLCDVVAVKEGTVVSVEAYGGSPVVKKGDRVCEGDMLISSYMEGSFGVVRYVHAYGKVLAAVNYEYTVDVPLEYVDMELTGREASKMSFRLLGFEARLFGDENSPYQKCNVISSEERLEIFGIKFPVEIEKSVYYETKAVKKRQSEKEAEIKALKDYESYKAREIKGEIISESYECVFDEEQGVVRLIGVLSVVEDIGEKIFLE